MRDRLLTACADLVCRRPWMVIVVAALLAGVSAIYAATSLRLNANTDDLIAPSRPFMKQYRRLLDEFGDLDFLYVIVAAPHVDLGAAGSSDDHVPAREVVDALTARLRQIDELPGVYSGITPDEQRRIATRAMPIDELRELAQASGGIAMVREASSPAELVAWINAALSRLLIGGVNGGGMDRQQQERLGAAAIFALKVIAAASGAHEHSTTRPEMQELFGAALEHEYFHTENGRLHLITIVPEKNYGTLAVIEEPLRKIRAAIAEVQRQFPDVEIGLTGKPVLQADEMATTNRDMRLSATLGFVIVAVLFMIVIRGFWRPALAAIAFAFAGAWTYGAAALLVGQLNLLSVVFALVLVGIGFDFGIHFITRYNERRCRAKRDRGAVDAAVHEAMLTSGRGNITSAITSSAVFFAALATSFLGLRELGLIAGVGLLLCLVSMTLVLPAMLVVWDRRRAARRAAAAGVSSSAVEFDREAAVAEADEQRSARGVACTDHPRMVLGGIAVFTLFLAIVGGLVGGGGRGGLPRFEDNLLELQARGLDSVKWEHRLVRESTDATWFGAIMADDIAKVMRIVERAAQFPSIGKVRSALDVIQPPSEERETLRQRLHDHPAPVERPQAQQRELAASDVRAAIQAVELMAPAASGSSPEDAAMLRSLAHDLDRIASAMEDPARAEAMRARIGQTMQDAARMLEIMLQGDGLPLREALPGALRPMYVSPAGTFLVMLHPRENIWEISRMRPFIDDLRAIDPLATGAPIAHYESLFDMKYAFQMMAMLALLIVTALVWLDFRSISDTLLAMLPVIIGLLWTIGLMDVLDISFNLANFFSLPILLGVGVDSAVHILHRYREGGPARFHLGSTRRAVILTASTTMIGFGALVLAHHRGLQSLGLVMVIGSAACLVASMVLLPAALAMRERLRGAA